MPSNPNKIIVRAAIPNAEDPSLHVLDYAGRYPQISSESGQGASIEDLLHAIGNNVIKKYLSIDKQLDRKSTTTNSGHSINIAEVKAKPIDPNTTNLEAGYSWGPGHI